MADPADDSIPLRDYLERLIAERDRTYEARFKASEVAVNAALASQEKAVAAAFLASEKAIVKAEVAQKDYNERSNEFRGQLDDQAKTLMPRPETLTMFSAMEDKLESVSVNFKIELGAAKTSFEKELASLESQVVSLREFRSDAGGAAAAHAANTETKHWMITIAIAIAAIVAGYFLHR